MVAASASAPWETIRLARPSDLPEIERLRFEMGQGLFLPDAHRSVVQLVHSGSALVFEIGNEIVGFIGYPRERVVNRRFRENVETVYCITSLRLLAVQKCDRRRIIAERLVLEAMLRGNVASILEGMGVRSRGAAACIYKDNQAAIEFAFSLDATLGDSESIEVNQDPAGRGYVRQACETLRGFYDWQREFYVAIIPQTRLTSAAQLHVLGRHGVEVQGYDCGHIVHYDGYDPHQEMLWMEAAALAYGLENALERVGLNDPAEVQGLKSVFYGAITPEMMRESFLELPYPEFLGPRRSKDPK